MARILVTGGAGYIGSHIVRELTGNGHTPMVIDDLSQGHRSAVGTVPLIEADFGDPESLDRTLADGDFEFVVHMAASCEVGESVREPASYYDNNLQRSLRLLDAVRRHEIRGVVFSSTAAVYGEPERVPITEGHPQRPTNPYGETKLSFERALHWYRKAYGTRFVALRYFNAAGAHPDGDIGEDHAVETHLVPRLLQTVQQGNEPTPVFGSDYPTRDGTCVRDYVHVMDLAQAHVLALEAMAAGRVEGEAFNLGNGEGFSVLEVVEAVGEVTGTRPATEMADRRPGDPATLVASADLARARLGWVPRFPALDEIIGTAWNWHERHPDGFGD